MRAIVVFLVDGSFILSCQVDPVEKPPNVFACPGGAVVFSWWFER